MKFSIMPWVCQIEIDARLRRLATVNNCRPLAVSAASTCQSG